MFIVYIMFIAAINIFLFIILVLDIIGKIGLALLKLSGKDYGD